MSEPSLSATTMLPKLADFGDNLSPMVVKELRHGLRTRFFTIALMLFHALLIFLMIGAAVSATFGVEVKYIHGIFWMAVVGAMMAALPLRAFNALHAEKQDNTLDILTLTSMPSLRIVYGKWAALFSQTLLFVSSLLPYIVARYYFGGVELARELVALLFLVVGSGLVTAVLVTFSSQDSLVLRLFLAAGVLVANFPASFFIYSIIAESMGDELVRGFAALLFWQQSALVIGFVILSVYGIYLLLAIGASRIAPPSENHSTCKRLIGMAIALLLTVTGLALCFSPEPEHAFWAFVPLMFLTTILGMDVLTEEMPRFPTVISALLRRGTTGRLSGRYFFHPGWASGVGFYIALCLLPVGLLVVTLMANHDEILDDELAVTVCLLAIPVVPVVVRIQSKSLFANWWTVQWILIAAGILLAIFCGVTNSREMGTIGVLTPITTFFGSSVGRFSDNIGIGAFFSLLWFLLAMGFAKQGMDTYTELEVETMRLQDAPQPTRSDDPAIVA